MAETLPFTLLPPEEGKVRLLAMPEPRFCNLTNTVHSGWIMTMLDTAMTLSAQMMVLGRVIQALGACAASVLSRALARDLFDGDALARALALTMITGAAAPGFSPLLGSAL